MRVFIVMGFALALCTEASADRMQYKGSPKFSHGCDFRGKDQFGDKVRTYCWLSVNNLSGAGLLIGLSYKIGLETIVEVDEKGVRLVKSPAWEGCEGFPRRVAVDGRRIDALPQAQQMSAMRDGEIFVREEQAPWPGCGIAPHATRLTGFGEALDEMLAQWAARPK